MGLFYKGQFICAQQSPFMLDAASHALFLPDTLAIDPTAAIDPTTLLCDNPIQCTINNRSISAIVWDKLNFPPLARASLN
jgi:hypothetical protein